MLLPPPPLSPFDVLRLLPPTAITELQWGEPHSEAFGTGARVAGSISLWLVLLPSVANCGQSRLYTSGWSGWRRGKRGRVGVANLSFVESGPWGTVWLYVEAVSIYRLEFMGRCSYPPPLSPSDDLRPLPPTAITESQWGEPRSEAVGTSAHVAGSVVNPDLTPPGGQVGEEESGVGRELDAWTSISVHGERSFVTLYNVPLCSDFCTACPLPVLCYAEGHSLMLRDDGITRGYNSSDLEMNPQFFGPFAWTLYCDLKTVTDPVFWTGLTTIMYGPIQKQFVSGKKICVHTLSLPSFESINISVKEAQHMGHRRITLARGIPQTWPIPGISQPRLQAVIFGLSIYARWQQSTNIMGESSV
ncbi:hypothetical protein EI94DRAFT_1701341 [Lactarius quietus]|nr:hypothetical protein EI94DRAFT_1701341 [Lactarius quietus]